MSGAEVIPFERPDEKPYEDAPPEVVRALSDRIPTVQQWEAISHPLSPVAVIAGAGSGKTAVMAARVAYLTLVATGRLEASHEGAMPSQMLCLTFTNKAAGELAVRVRRAVQGLGLPEGEEPTVLTYHAFAARLLMEEGLRLGREPGDRLLSDAQKWQLMTSCLDEVEFEHYEVRSDWIVGDALQLADQIANHLVEPEAVAAWSAEVASKITGSSQEDVKERFALLKRVDLARLVEEYDRRKKQIGAIDYGDQIAEATRLVDEHPEVGEAFRERYRVVLLDEYQDTNVAQARLLSGLFGLGYPVFAVGDPDQNIYAWRGASLQNILRFQDDFGTAGAEPDDLPLFVNFRSGSKILDAANAVIGEVPEERRAAGKILRPDKSKGEGSVLGFVAGDARGEGEEIARIILEESPKKLRDGEPEWDRFAVLCRKKKLFGPIAEVLREHDIPVEIVDLGGLLEVPEVVDVVSWLKLLDDPARNIALARILMGPRWRIGYRDLVALARWSATHNARLRKILPETDDDMPGDVAFALAEALDHLDDEEMTGLSKEGRTRLQEFRGLLGDLREASAAPLVDLVGQIVERTGLLRELEASTHHAAKGARQNLLNLLQFVSSFAPVDGEATLSTLVSYFAEAEKREEDLETAQPSEANTVKLLTVHKAKGLEWDVVFVPGMAEHTKWGQSSIFPDVSRQPNPLSQAATLPFELRGDADVLPRFEGDVKAFRAALKERGLEEERRLCYVALTRARDLLVTSAAYWYGELGDRYEPGKFLEEVSNSGVCELIRNDDPPEENPLIEERRARAEQWPRQARADDTDELFPEGWHAAAREVAEDHAIAEWRAVQALDPAGIAAYREELEKHQERAELIRERTAVSLGPQVPTSLSVSGLIDYAKCPALFYWSSVRPLPRRPNPRARLGSEVHRWIENQSRGQASLLDLDELPDLATEERLGELPPEAQLQEAFRKSRFFGTVPIYAERPFLLWIDGFVIRGRIDAIYEREGGGWEVVDYKTGRVPPPGDPITSLQLDVYALACIEIWGRKPEELTLTYLYLGEGEGGTEVTTTADEPDALRARIKVLLEGIGAGKYKATPGRQCHWCDFLPFCAPGKEYVEQNPR
jgi:DNA helicase-2/ATP-dependent DNA helicase PcrA